MKIQLYTGTMLKAAACVCFGVAALMNCRGADVNYFLAVKGQEFLQASTGAPVAGLTPWHFSADVKLRLPDLVTNATVKLPSNVTVSLAGDCTDWYGDGNFASQAALDAAYGNGNYTFTAYTLQDGTRAPVLSVTNNQYPSSAPHVTNYTAAQAINPAASFRLGWDPFPGGTTNDFVLLQVDNEYGSRIFQTPMIGEPGALNGLTNTYTFPADFLPPGQTNYATLIFGRGFTTTNNAAYPNARTIAAYYKQTEFTMVTAGTPDTATPQFVWASPWNGETGVPVNSSISFTFDKPMSPKQSIYWSPNLNSNRFTYTWLADRTTLVCTYYTNLPADSTIFWTLNPSSGVCDYFEDISGNIAFSDQAGSFDTGNTGAGAKDVTLYGCGKIQSFTQTNSAVPAVTNEIAFETFIDLSAPYTITNATIRLPSSGVRTVVADSSSGDSFYFKETFSTQPALDAAYPSGNYVMTVQCVHDGNRVATNNLAGSYPNIPRVSNFPAAQSVNPALNFTLTWDAFTGGTTNDFIQVDIRDGFGDSVFKTPGGPFLPGALHGTSNSVVIPSGTLTGGQTYQAEMFFAKLVTVNSSSYPGVVSLTFYARRTEFTLHATGVMQPLLSQPTRLSPSQFRFLLTGVAGQNYTLQANANPALATNGWFQILVTNAPGNTITITDPNATNNQRIYRALLGP